MDLRILMGILAYKNGKSASVCSLNYKNRVGMPEKTHAISIVPEEPGNQRASDENRKL